MRLEIDVNEVTPRGVTACGRQAPVNDIRGVRGDNWSEGRLRCRWLAPVGAEKFRTRMVLEAEPVTPNYPGALGDQQGYSLV